VKSLAEMGFVTEPMVSAASQWVGVAIVLASIGLIYGRSISTAEPVTADSRMPVA
jgi:hypothetical protein